MIRKEWLDDIVYHANCMLNEPWVNKHLIYDAIELGTVDTLLTEEYESCGLLKHSAEFLLDCINNITEYINEGQCSPSVHDWSAYIIEKPIPEEQMAGVEQYI